MSAQALSAVIVREGKIRATNALFIFWDLLYPLGYLLVFGAAMDQSMGFTSGLAGVDYNAFFLAGVLGMASFGIAANTSWSFFLDRDNGIFYEMLTYPLSRTQYLIGKVLFNELVGLVQALLTVALAALLLGVPLRPGGAPLLMAATLIGTAGWFFFYAIFALRIRRNDAFNTVTSVFYFFFLFASSMFYPLEPLPPIFRLVARLNPITWQVDVLRYATIGTGSVQLIAIEAAAFVGFTLVSFAAAIWALDRQG
jgi:ABC-2 type transport system permease protein